MNNYQKYLELQQLQYLRKLLQKTNITSLNQQQTQFVKNLPTINEFQQLLQPKLQPQQKKLRPLKDLTPQQVHNFTQLIQKLHQNTITNVQFERLISLSQ